MESMVLSISEIQEIGTEMLHAVSDICERHSLRWNMAYGSCLGAIRHHGPIPWDYDIDIYIVETDLQAFIHAMQDELPSKFWVDFRDGPGQPRAFPRIGLRGYETDYLHIDVYRLGGFPNNKASCKLFTLYSRFLKVVWKSKTIDIEFYYPDEKRKVISRTVRFLASCIPLNSILRMIDKQAGRVPYEKAVKVASTLTIRNPKKMLDRSVFDESTLVEYEDFSVRVPSRYETYLEAYFGEWKKFPPLSEREACLSRKFFIRSLNARK